MVFRQLVVALMGVAMLQVGGLACSSSPYHLPEPPKEAGQEEPDPQQPTRNPDLEARSALLELYQMLSEERFEDAEDRLSQQTRDFLSHGDDSSDASNTLSAGQMTLPDGRTYRFDPVELLIAPDVARIADSIEGADEHETSRRRELFVIDSNDQTHRVVMIREGDQWVLHKTSVSPQNES